LTKWIRTHVWWDACSPRGWALSVGLIALPYYQSTDPVLAAIARHTIDEVLADLRHAV
jgi:hypothetical protein